MVKAVLHPGMLFPVMFISARHDDGAGGEFGVIGHHDAAFTGVDELIGLERKTADLADGADLATVPFGAQRMGGIFDDRHAAGIAQGHDRIHIRGMAAHVGDQHRVCVRQLCREIGHIHPIICANFDQYRHTIGMKHRRRHGSKGKGRDQHFCPARQVQRFQRQKQRGGTAGHRQRVARPHEGGKLSLQQGHRRAFGGGVAKQVTRAQQPFNFQPRLIRDRFGVVKVGSGNLRVAGHSFAFPELIFQETRK